MFKSVGITRKDRAEAREFMMNEGMCQKVIHFPEVGKGYL